MSSIEDCNLKGEKRMNKWDKVVYDYHIDNSELKYHSDRPLVDGLVDTFYQGVLRTQHEGTAKVMEAPHVQMMAKGVRGRIDRTIDLVSLVTEKLNSEGLDPNDEGTQDGQFNENDAKISNLFGSDGFKASLKQMQDNQNKVDVAMSCYSPNGIGAAPNAGADTMQLRKKLMDGMKYGDRRIKAIMEIFGRLLKHVNQIKKEQVFPDASNIVDVTLGNDFQKLLPDEYLKFAIPELEHLSNLQFINEELLQFKTEKKKETGKGDVILMIDTSGSMQDPFEGGKRIDAAIAFAMLVVKIMNDDNRHCKIFTFDRDTYLLGNTRKESGPAILNKLLRISPSGGTSIGTALSVASYETEDMLMITDAEDGTNFFDLKSDKRKVVLQIGSWRQANLERVVDKLILCNNLDAFKTLGEELVL